MQLALVLLFPGLARLQLRDATTLGLPPQQLLQTAGASANASAANASAADAAPPDGTYALDSVSAVLTLHHYSVADAEAIRPAIVAVVALKLEVHAGEVQVSLAAAPCARPDLCVTPNKTAATSNDTSSNGSAPDGTGTNGTANSTVASSTAALIVRKLSFLQTTAPAGTDVEVKVELAGFLADPAKEAKEKLAELQADQDALLATLKTEVAQQQLNPSAELSALSMLPPVEEQAFVQLPIQGCSDLDAQDTGRWTAGPGSAPASCQDLAQACSGGANADVRAACPQACRLCAVAAAPIAPPPDLPVAAAPDHAAAGSVGMHVGAPQAVVASADPDLLAQANTTFVLQLVANEDTPGSLIGMPGQVLDPNNDHCLIVGDLDDLGGYALKWAHCRHQDTDYDPARVPAEMQFYFLQDGRVASAVNASSTSANCILQKSCDGAMVYDLGDCASPEAVLLQVRASVAQSAERTKYVGTPLQGAVEAGGMFSDIHGPFQMYSHCDGVQTGDGCMHLVPRAGWTKLESQYLGENSFTEKDPAPVPPLPLKDMAYSALHGDQQAVRDAASAAALGTSKALAGVQAGLGSTGDRDRCGTWVTDGDRQFAWWYFVSATKGNGTSADSSAPAFVQEPFLSH